jgi:hypothetical protein
VYVAGVDITELFEQEWMQNELVEIYLKNQEL